MMRTYKEEELVRVAKRDNNTRRPYLLVNPLQGKHIPVSPARSMELFEALSGVLSAACKGEKLLLIGFAETATAIGAAVAANCPEEVWYMHTTRECVAGAGQYLYFSEVHSHATEQKLIADCLDEAVEHADRIVFEEDEVTTGNTILNLIGCLKERYHGAEGLSFGILSILNSMTDAALEHFRELNIPCLYLNRIEGRDYTEELEPYRYEAERIHGCAGAESGAVSVTMKTFPGKQNPRIGVLPKDYRRACEVLAEVCVVELTRLLTEEGAQESESQQSESQESESRQSESHQSESRQSASQQSASPLSGKRLLVLGTEEFMYPALVAAEHLEREAGSGLVRFHATTRSPILPSGEADYPLSSRYELRSVYDGDRTTYIYNLECYDAVLWLHDAPEADHQGISSLSAALESAGCRKLFIGKWGD